MKEVKTQKRYKCDFCKKRGIVRTMKFHEQNCYRNPRRVCSTCNNTGKYEYDAGDDNSTMVEATCPYCEKFDKQKLEDIKEYELSSLDKPDKE